MLFILIFFAELNVDSYGVSYNRAFSLSRKKKNRVKNYSVDKVKKLKYY